MIDPPERDTLPLARRALPGPGMVELWLTDLGRMPLGPDGISDTLGPALKARKLRQRFLLRLLLGAYLGRPGKAIRFVRNGHGKPALDAGGAQSPLEFNLSHSGSWLAVAVSRDVPVGVDIENRRVLSRSLDLARRFLSEAEAAYLEALPEPRRSERFLELWTQREALVKAMGQSLASALGELALEPAEDGLRALPAAWPAMEQWSLLRGGLPPELLFAVALPQAGFRLQTILLDCTAGS